MSDIIALFLDIWFEFDKSEANPNDNLLMMRRACLTKTNIITEEQGTVEGVVLSDIIALRQSSKARQSPPRPAQGSMALFSK